MRSAVVLLLCGILVLPATATADPRTMMMPSPLGILLTLGQWTMRDRVEVFYVQVQAHGRDEPGAIDSAFRLAVNQAVGSLLLSHKHVANQEVLRNEIINYSSGHVHDFKILESRAQDGGRLVVMDVWVRRSLIADRLLNESRDASQIEGGRIAAQIQSLEARKRSTEQVLESVLQDFPQRSFELTVSQTQVLAGPDRSYWLVVPVHVQWSRTYLTSLAEAVKTVDPNPRCSGWLARCEDKVKIAVAGTVAHFDDQTIYGLFSRHLFESRPVLRVRIRDNWGSVKYQQCFEAPEITQSSWAPWYFLDVGGNRATLNAGRSKTFNVYVNLGPLPVKTLDRAEADVVRMSSCKQ